MPVSAEPLSGIYWTELRILLEVANAQSFNKAAQQLNVSHPNSDAPSDAWKRPSARSF
jgi:hypothetical protein